MQIDKIIFNMKTRNYFYQVVGSSYQYGMKDFEFPYYFRLVLATHPTSVATVNFSNEIITYGLPIVAGAFTAPSGANTWRLSQTNNNANLPITLLVGNNNGSPTHQLHNGLYTSDPLEGNDATLTPSVLNCSVYMSIGLGKHFLQVTINGIAYPVAPGSTTFYTAGVSGAKLSISFITD